MTAARVALQPEGVRAFLARAIEDGGGSVVPASEANVLVWTEPNKPAELDAFLRGPGADIEWVAVPFAGVEPYLSVIKADRIWTCGKGVYAEPVAEHALALLLAGLRGLGTYARETTWTPQRGTNLLGGKVVIVGAGGITESLLRLLAPFGADITVVRRHPDGPVSPALAVADHIVGVDDLDEALEGAVGVVLALALTPDTEGIIGRAQLERMSPQGWIVNVARGRHIVTEDLVGALRANLIGGAALDVTEPEPLPDEHPLWTLPNCIITPHTANTLEMAGPLLSARITENIQRWVDGQPLVGLVDPSLGY